MLAFTLNVVYLSEITAKALTFCDRTDDITYCADLTLFLHATSGGLSITDCSIFLDRFLAFHRFKCYLGSFSRYMYITVFLPNTVAPKYADQD